jgi:hypothetical protein
MHRKFAGRSSATSQVIFSLFERVFNDGAVKAWKIIISRVQVWHATSEARSYFKRVNNLSTARLDEYTRDEEGREIGDRAVMSVGGIPTPPGHDVEDEVQAPLLQAQLEHMHVLKGPRAAHIALQISQAHRTPLPGWRALAAPSAATMGACKDTLESSLQYSTGERTAAAESQAENSGSQGTKPIPPAQAPHPLRIRSYLREIYIKWVPQSVRFEASQRRNPFLNVRLGWNTRPLGPCSAITD